MNDSTFSSLPGTAATARNQAGSQRGITLTELLVVLVVIGIGALVVLENLNTMYRKYELESSVRSLAAFFNEMPNAVKEQNREVYLVWDPDNAIVKITVKSDGTEVVQRYNIPTYLDVKPDAELTFRCDTIGRAYLGTNSKMLSAVQQFEITHTAMLSGMVEPAMTYTLTLSPLWNVTTSKRLD